MEQHVKSGTQVKGGGRIVFLGPTNLEIDESWTQPKQSLVESKDILQWKVRRYLTSMQTVEKRLCYSSQDELIRDPLLEVRKRKDGHTLTLTKGNLGDTQGTAESGRRRSHDTRVGYKDTVDHRDDVVDEMGACVPTLIISSDQSDAGSALATREDPVQSNAEGSRLADCRTRKVLGPARQVGLSRKERLQSRNETHGGLKPPFLKTMKRARERIASAQEDVNTLVTSEGTGSENCTNDTVATDAQHSVQIDVGTTNDSIPPGPTHGFEMGEVKHLKDILNDPQKMLSPLQGGEHQSDPFLPNILVLVRQVGSVLECRTWKGQRSSKDVRCDLIVQDKYGYTLKLVLEGSCASEWCGEKAVNEEIEDDQASLENTDADLDYSMSMADYNNISRLRRMQQRAMPIKPGDVVYFGRVRLRSSRFRSAPTGHRSSPKNAVLLANNMYASASVEGDQRSSIELCWRNDVVTTHDKSFSFDPALITLGGEYFQTVYKLATDWRTT